MPGIWCPRCQTQVRLEQDGLSCSNCGRQLVIAAPEPTPTPPPRKRAPRTRKRVRRPTAKPTGLAPPTTTPTQAA